MADPRAATEALAATIAEFDELEADEQQLGLFADPATAGGLKKLPKHSAQRTGMPGRPPGARNKRTAATVALLLQRYRDPRAIALERIAMHPADLAAQLGISIAGADERQRLWATAILPYIAEKVTPDTSVFGGQVIHLTVNTGGAGEAAAEAIRIVEPGQAEDVSAEEAVASTTCDDAAAASHKPAHQEDPA